MKVLIIANSDMGLYKFRREVLEALLKENEVYITLPNGEFVPAMQEMGCKFIDCQMDRRGMNPLKEIKLVSAYLKTIRSIKPDAVLTYTIKPNVYGGLACRLLRVPYIANVTGLGTTIENGGMLAKITLLLYRIGLKRSKCTFFQNKANMQLLTTNGVVKGKTRLIPGSGVNTEDHAFKEYPSTDDGIRFLFIGRVMRDKGINELLYAIRLVHEHYPQVTLDIVGGFDEDYSAVMDDAVKSGYIRYHGKQSRVHEFIENAHCTILPSYHEGTANVLLESASTGRPVISCLIPGCQETFDDGVTGLGCEVKNVQSLVEAMEKFIELPIEKKAEMGRLGREKMIREYDRSIVINAYLEEIRKAMKETK